ncbi:MAG: PKD domain-containing protein [Bacteroidetes bacterium]|nr:MAG: PKD domain-containing protein [Bacteroidota bacterium]
MKTVTALLFSCCLLHIQALSALLTVTTSADSGNGSLRQTILDAAAGDQIVFSGNLFNQSIVLSSGEIVIDKDLTITGLGKDHLSLSSNGNQRIFSVLGGVTLELTDLTLEGSFINLQNGGAILCMGNLRLENCRFEQNGTTEEGGSIYHSQGWLHIERCEFVQNDAYSRGGGIFIASGELQLRNSLFENNTSSRFGAGGAIHIQAGTADIRQCLFNLNSSGGSSSSTYGGAISCNGMLTLENCSLTDNRCTARGQSLGGGLHIGTAGSATVNFCTITGNSVSAQDPRGGGIFNWGTLLLSNTIVAQNEGGCCMGIPDIGSDGNYTSLGYNLLGINDQPLALATGDIAGTPGSPLDPLLGPLQNNGGPTHTRALMQASPAVNAAQPGLFGLSDQRGFPRPVGGRADIGAFESAFVRVPDYVVSSLSLSAVQLQAGGAFDVQAMVENTGDGAADRHVRLGYYLSENSNWESGDVLLGTDDVEPLGPGQQSPESEGLNLPANLDAGSYFLIALADDLSELGELDENNNAAVVSFSVLPAPPVADFVASETHIHTGESVFFTSLSSGQVDQHSWSFPGGTPAVSNQPAPTVTYFSEGTYTVSLTVSNAGGSDTETKTAYIQVSRFQTDVVNLKAGWNLISIDVAPEDSSIEQVFSGLKPNNLEFVTGFEGGAIFYDPNGLPFLNTLTHLTRGFGYWVRVKEADVLQVEGVPLDAGYKKDLDENWNLVAYLPAESSSPTAHFASLIASDNLEYVTGFDGGAIFYDPNGLPFLNTLQLLSNGFGYWVKVKRAVSGQQYRQEVMPTPVHSFVYATTNLAPHTAGQWVRWESSGGKLLGSSQVLPNGMLSPLPIYGDDPSTAGPEGLMPGEEIWVNWQGVRQFTGLLFNGKRELQVAQLLFPASVRAYPNPFRHTVHLGFELYEPTAVSLQLLDLRGKTITRRPLGHLQAGPHEVSWRLPGLAAGAYLVEIWTGEQRLGMLQLLHLE